AAAPVPIDRSRAAVNSFLNEKLAVWQKRLALQDWKISLHVVRLSEFKPQTIGGIRWDRDTKTADIKVLDPRDYKTSYADTLNDLELTIVHELCHLQLSSLPRSEASRSAEEKAVNRLSEALVALERSTPQSPAAVRVSAGCAAPVPAHAQARAQAARTAPLHH
ncbi:MAG: hypothetical protein M1541_14320, partial [Acidobacteria bacterium]|nr:hypothetical protein [Acidobacteriota bacterium]